MNRRNKVLSCFDSGHTRKVAWFWILPAKMNFQINFYPSHVRILSKQVETLKVYASMKATAGFFLFHHHDVLFSPVFILQNIFFDKSNFCANFLANSTWFSLCLWVSVSECLKRRVLEAFPTGKTIPDTDPLFQGLFLCTFLWFFLAICTFFCVFLTTTPYLDNVTDHHGYIHGSSQIFRVSELLSF